MKRFLSSIFILGALFAIASCNDEETFSLSRADKLTFSTDTVSLDTLFSTTSSSTYQFWVYNLNRSGLRLANIRLAHGNQTGFRVNVNGTPLNGNNGFQASDMPIYHGDSLRVYVEATAPTTGVNAPQAFTEDLVFTLESGVEQRVKLRAWAWDATHFDFLDVRHDTVIDSPSRPIVISKGIKVNEGATLTVKAGTTIYFNHSAGVDVFGRLVLAGEAGKEVLMRGSRLDKMFDYLPYDRVSGQWQGLHFHSSSYQNQLSHTEIHGCFDGIVCDSSDVSREKLRLEQVTVHNCQGDGVRLTNSKATLVNTQLTNTLGNCLVVDGGDVALNACTLAQFYPFDSNRGAALHIAAKHALVNLMVRNSIVTGYASEQVEVSLSRLSTSAYRFAHCLLRASKTQSADSVNYTNVIYEVPTDTVSMGAKLFLKVNGNRQDYDFHLSKQAFAIGKADKTTVPSIDRDGKRRNTVPDLGAYAHH